MEKKTLEIYVHIPFCIKKCSYCDFLSAPGTPLQQRQYMQALKREIRDFPLADDYQVSTLFFGGGTPSVLPESDLGEVLELLYGKFAFAEDPEITVECNPGTGDADKLRGYRSAGINRISFGLQSADDRELAILGRIHTWKDFQKTYADARNTGFENINVDLMSALPGQTVKSWESTLGQVLALRPEHISAYSLIIEEGTPFYERYAPDAEIRERGDQPKYLPSEEAERRMYRLTGEMLGEAGLHRYEISNYAAPGFACRHNIGYWTGAEYVGFGLGASSLLNHVRYRNPFGMEKYLAGDFKERVREPLTQKDEMEEFMFLGLRLTEGISEAEFQKRFSKAVEEVYAPVLKKMQQYQLLRREEGRIALTERGTDVSNMVLAEFLL